MSSRPHKTLAEWMRRFPRSQALHLLLGVGLAGGVLSISCSVERDYRTLSFFFDGVPDPNAAPEPTPGSGPAVAGPLAVAVPEPPRGSTHAPFLNRECEGCHIFEKTSVQRPAWLLGTPKLKAPLEELCAGCHEAPQAAYVHGPVAMLRCDLCHSPHDSRYPHLLRMESANETCLSCHTGETFTTQAAHADYGPAECCACHDPHASDLPFLLKPEEQRAVPLHEEPVEDLAPEPGP